MSIKDEVRKREEEIAKNFVLEAKKDDEEIWKDNTITTLSEMKDARIYFSPENVWTLIVKFAKEEGVTINRHY